MIKTSVLLIHLTLLALLIPTTTISGVSEDENANIKELTATTSETHLIMFGTLANSFTTEMIEILHSGIKLKFTFYVELYKVEGNWPEEQIVAYSFEHGMSFDTLKEIYEVTLEEDNNKIQSFKSIFDAQKVINEINGAKVLPLAQLIPDNFYKLKVRAELYKKTLPLSLQNVFPFLTWGDVKTEWQTIEFKY